MERARWLCSATAALACQGAIDHVVERAGERARLERQQGVAVARSKVVAVDSVELERAGASEPVVEAPAGFAVAAVQRHIQCVRPHSGHIDRHTFC